MTPKELFETQIAGRLNSDESLKDLDAVYQFNVSGDEGGNWTVNLRDSIVSQGTDDAADCTIGILGCRQIADRPAAASSRLGLGALRPLGLLGCVRLRDTGGRRSALPALL